MNYDKLSPDELELFEKIHNQILPHRKERFTTYDIYSPNFNFEEDKGKYTLCQPLLNKAKNILYQNNVHNIDIKTYAIEFHQRNCGFDKKKHDWCVWHYDSYGIMDEELYSVLFYIRKDKTVQGGNLKYVIENTIYTHIVTSGDILSFAGNLKHKPESTWGFGCRDLICVFIKKT